MIPQFDTETYQCVGRGRSSCPTRPAFRVGQSVFACTRHVALVMTDVIPHDEPVPVTRLVLPPVTA